jgi:hypothetical protein
MLQFLFDAGRDDKHLKYSWHKRCLPDSGDKACGKGTIRKPQQEATLANT